jgi:energy-coupling factor transporter ATP-binding protein EcfA2
MLNLTGISKTYPGGVHALQDIHLEVPRGMFGLLGPNGAGKSTLMRTVATLQQPDCGSITFNGIDILQDKTALRRKYGLPPAPRVPKLGDPAHSDRLALGVDSRTAFEIVLSTSADQIAVAPGVLLKEWQQGGRRYFHYKAEEPILPNLSFCSARYEVARDRWKDVALEIYYDPKHPFNIPAMMETAKRALEYYSREFAPYQYSYLRILE